MPGPTENGSANGHIKNPLTVISRFAAIAEISGTAVLPFIEPANQATYIWFLMLFPALLVSLFFLTLNYNHKTLYAPSDYQNQNHFLNLFGIATSDERQNKLEQEVMEKADDLTDQQNSSEGLNVPLDDTEANVPAIPPASDLSDSEAPTPPANTSAVETSQHQSIEINSDKPEQTPPCAFPSQPNEPIAKENTKKLNLAELKAQHQTELMERLDLVENEAIRKLKTVTKLKFDRNVKLETNELDQPIIFDGLVINSESVHAAEVKYFEHNKFNSERFAKTLQDAYLADKAIRSTLDRKFFLHIVVVIDGSISPERFEMFAKTIQRLGRGYGLRVTVYGIEADKLLDRTLDHSFYKRSYLKG